jgi:hypothetical protein
MPLRLEGAIILGAVIATDALLKRGAEAHAKARGGRGGAQRNSGGGDNSQRNTSHVEAPMVRINAVRVPPFQPRG